MTTNLQIKGTWNEVKGKLKQKYGQLTDPPKDGFAVAKIRGRRSDRVKAVAHAAWSRERGALTRQKTENRVKSAAALVKPFTRASPHAVNIEQNSNKSRTFND